MENIRNAMESLNEQMSDFDQSALIPFDEFLKIMANNPSRVIRNVFQVFYDMIHYYVEEGVDEYPNDPETIQFMDYNCNSLFVDGTDHPFFADRLFSNRLLNHVEALKHGAQQNKIYIFEGPHGSGKSTFLNNLLMKFEEYANIDEGCRFEAVWKIDKKFIGNIKLPETTPLMDKLYKLVKDSSENYNHISEPDDIVLGKEQEFINHTHDDYIEIPCVSHDNPILMIPKQFRRQFFDNLFQNDEFKWKLFTEKTYEWVFRDNPCTVCNSIYHALLNKLKSPIKVFQMLYARKYRFNRRLGEGISVFNPGDKPGREHVFGNPMLQNRINRLFQDSNQVKYIFSRYAKTNSGVYALMDIKSHNTERLVELHNIISEGVHKVEEIEENVDSLFIALMNPEDKKNIQDFPSFSDRIEYIRIPYVLDINTEIEIYRNIFGRHIDTSFLPRVLHNFARVIISSRLKPRSDTLLEWIGDPSKYSLYCDSNLQLLKMEIFTGYIPPWLSEDDRKKFTAKRRRKIIAESEKEGIEGFSGRDSIKIFNEFYSTYARQDKLISMSSLHKFFTTVRKDLNEKIPRGFMDSLLRMYNYTVLQEVKEALYYYNQEQISKDIQNYMFAVNFEAGSTARCRFTGDKLEISELFLQSIENHIIGAESDRGKRAKFRKDVQKEYTSTTLTQEIMVEEKDVTQTNLHDHLHERYVYNLKEKVLDPFLKNENFRMAIKDFHKEEFKTYDQKIRSDVTFLMKNLTEKFHYSKQGAQEVCIYVIDNDLAKKFANA